MSRSRPIYFVATVFIVMLGLLSRSYPQWLPAVLGKYPGDFLWAMMMFCGLGYLFPSAKTFSIGLLALAICYAVEFSQLYHADWLEAWRETLPGKLILGRGFSWLDLLAYTFGIMTAGVLEQTTRRFFRNRKK